MADAAAVTSLIARSVVRDFGLTSRPTRAAAGISSCSNPSCFDPSSATKKFTPVALPPGRLWLATRPNGTGSLLTPKDNGDCHGCRLGRQRDKLASSRGDHVDPLANQLSR